MRATHESRQQPSRARPWILTVLVGLVFLLGPVPTTDAAGPRVKLFELTAKKMEEADGGVRLPSAWRYHPGNDDPGDLSFARHGLDDSAWSEVDARFTHGDRPPDWTGSGWFRLRFWVDPSLEGEALVLSLNMFGAAEVYLDGRLLTAVGAVGPDADHTQPQLHRQPQLFTFDHRSVHVLAIRFANHDAEAYEAVGHFGGFEVEVGEANDWMGKLGQKLVMFSLHKAFFTGVFGAFALLHLLLYAFYSESRENLYFALLTGNVAFLAFLFLDQYATPNPGFFLFYYGSMNTGWLFLAVCAVRFAYSLLGDRLPRMFWGIAGLAAILLVPGWLWPRQTAVWILALLLIASIEMARAVVLAIRRRRPGAKTLGLGILALALGFSVWLLALLDIVPGTLLTLFQAPFLGMFLLIFLMSVHLSRSFARTSRELRVRLGEVEELSQLQIEQERRAREEAVERARLEAELEEARRLQLSMLPSHLPELPDLEIAANMQTATEVGGDYYDFAVGQDGTLTVAIGDATGHGMKAGTMVTATKSLFGALEDGAELPATLERFTRALRRMNLRQLSMALTLVRFNQGRLCLSAAGMPPALLFRAASQDVESLEIEGAPLGSFIGFRYQETALDLEPGDTVLLMSDGFPERLNQADEMLGYEKAVEAFSRAAARNGSPNAIIERLVADGEDWAAGTPPQDDMTFVVLRRTTA